MDSIDGFFFSFLFLQEMGEEGRRKKGERRDGLALIEENVEDR